MTKTKPSDSDLVTMVGPIDIIMNTSVSSQITTEQKKQLVNLNIPLASFYYALSIIQSTYNKETGPLLKKYYENRDLFMEDWKKRKEKK